MNLSSTSAETIYIGIDGEARRVHHFVEMRHYSDDPEWNDMPTGFLICDGCGQVIPADCDHG
jgi:hypothetical protein